MRLSQTYDWSDKKRKFSIATAVDRELDGAAYDQGRMEDTDATVRNCRQFIAQLTQRLFDAGILSKDDILALLSGYEEAAP